MAEASVGAAWKSRLHAVRGVSSRVVGDLRLRSNREMSDLDAIFAAAPIGEDGLVPLVGAVAEELRSVVGCASVEIWLWRNGVHGAPVLARMARAGAPIPEIETHEDVELVGDRALDGNEVAVHVDSASGRRVLQAQIGLHGHVLLALGDARPTEPLIAWLTHAMEDLAEEVARRLPHAELVEMNRWLLRRNTIDRAVARTFAKVRTLAELGRTIDAVTDRLFVVEYSGIYFLDPDTGALRLVHAKGLTEAERAAAERSAEARHPGHVLRTGRAVDVPDTSAHAASEGEEPPSHGKQILSRMYLPVRVDGIVVGTVGFASTRRASFSSRHRRALSFLADFAGLTYARIVSAHESARRSSILVASQSASERILGGFDWRGAANAALALVGSALGAGALALIQTSAHASASDSDAATDSASENDPPSEFLWQPTFGSPWPHSEQLARLTDAERERLRAGDSVVIQCTNSTSEQNGDHAGFASLMIKPVLVDGFLWGVLVHESMPGSHRSLDVGDRSALRALANAFELAIGRERVDQLLRQRQKMEAVGLLASGLAKDLNNLLWPILLYTEMLERNQSLDARTRQMLGHIRISARELTSLVQQVLALSRRRDRQSEPFAVGPVLQAVGELLRRSAPQALEIEVSLDSNLGDMLGDADALHHAVTRVCARAVELLRNRSGRIALRAEAVEQDGRPAIRILIEDSAPGMDAQTCARLFDPYANGSAGRGPATGSSGLALAAVQRIVTELNGRIAVESSLAKGTRFELIFPGMHAPTPARAVGPMRSDARSDDFMTFAGVSAASDATKAAQPIGAPASLAQTAEPSLPARVGETILLVDDDPFVLDVEREMLESVGYVVRAFGDPAKALEFLAEPSADVTLMVTDLTMPGMTGIDLAERARKLRPTLRIVCCTGFGDDRSEQRGFRVGIKSFVRKPIDLDSFVQTLRAAIDG
jgi:signal transduction histidine kinase/putative methionine-R-sulfoxide reductase with GAF domain